MKGRKSSALGPRTTRSGLSSSPSFNKWVGIYFSEGGRLITFALGEMREKRRVVLALSVDSGKERVFEYHLRVTKDVPTLESILLSLSEDQFFLTKESLLFP